MDEFVSNISEIDYSRLKAKIKNVYGNQETFADALGVTLQTVSNKLNGRSVIDTTDIIDWSNALGIGLYEISTYFFSKYD